MMYRSWPLVAAVLLATDAGLASAASLSSTPSSWTIGPIIAKTNYSSGVSPMPTPAGSVNYVTVPQTLSMVGKTISMCFDVVGPGTFKATDGSQAKVRFYFQRKGDNWTAKGTYEDYRWW